MISQLAGAALRAALVVMLIAFPSLFLGGTTADALQFTVLIAICAGIFVFVEYHAAAPSLIAFTNAPPFNRIRFLGLFAGIIWTTMIASAGKGSISNDGGLAQLGIQLGSRMNFLLSPVRFFEYALPNGLEAKFLEQILAMAGLAYLITTVMIVTWCIGTWLKNWPNQSGGFNIWTNLPTFNVSTHGDILRKLERDGQINLILGIALPFLSPLVAATVTDLFTPGSLQNPHVLIWMVALWAFVPAFLVMRGIAVLRLSQMITAQRERAYIGTRQKTRAKGPLHI